jgi:ATP-dependent DNA helicase RecQ
MIPSLLNQYFGFSALRPGQEAVISRVLAGQSAAVINCRPSPCLT